MKENAELIEKVKSDLEEKIERLHGIVCENKMVDNSEFVIDIHDALKDWIKHFDGRLRALEEKRRK